eukprot:5994789-Pyramimonas_sp.AAC.1
MARGTAPAGPPTRRASCSRPRGPAEARAPSRGPVSRPASVAGRRPRGPARAPPPPRPSTARGLPSGCFRVSESNRSDGSAIDMNRVGGNGQPSRENRIGGNRQACMRPVRDRNPNRNP